MVELSARTSFERPRYAALTARPSPTIALSSSGSPVSEFPIARSRAKISAGVRETETARLTVQNLSW